MNFLKHYFCIAAAVLLCMISYSQTDSSKVASPTIIDSIIRINNINSQHDTAKINDIIAIKLATQRPVSAFTTLYIDGIKIDNLKPWKISECDKTVFFQLNRDVEKLLLQFTENESFDKNFITTNLSIGTDSQCLARSSDHFYLEVKQKIKGIWVWVMSLLFVMLIIVALRNNALKDDNNLYFSLGRTQLFYWTILFVFSYLFICFRAGTLPDIPASILTILGISVGTTAASKVIENSTKNNTVIDADAKSQGWFLDILSDGTSINIHRFQNVIFNLVFGIIFIQKTISLEIMPSFDNNVLILLGISSGTYAGLKLTEATKEQNLPPAPVNSDGPSTPPPQSNQPQSSVTPPVTGT